MNKLQKISFNELKRNQLDHIRQQSATRITDFPQTQERLRHDKQERLHIRPRAHLFPPSRRLAIRTDRNLNYRLVHDSPISLKETISNPQLPV